MSDQTHDLDARKERDRIRGTAESTAPVILSVRDVSVEYKTPYGWMKAVNNSTMDIRRGEAVALIGESGSGKSTLGFALLRMLVRAARVSTGEAIFTDKNGTTYDLFRMTDKEFRTFRWDKMAMTFQAAQNVLNPVMRISNTFYETARSHGWNDKAAVKAKTLDLFKKVQLDPNRVFDAYPFELSGGMRQRVSIALSLLLDPELLILDEPTTALDIITQRAIIDVIKSLREQLDFTMIFVSHDLSLAAELADRVATMYAGEIVEYGPVRDVFYRPEHPYTVGLLNAVPPIVGEEFTPLVAIPGATPNLLNIPSGCPFHPRCPFATDICSTVNPPLVDVGGTHFVSCHNRDKVTRDQEVWEEMEATVGA
ncbi:MAG: ABC transporter ATP-binding protein [Thermomicrobiales bacterium]|nr:ABC transporter ATP-binding protein [Thermomicrobiales bacterium]MCO5227749.1 ABC transporter ATP-binding protein [Thermomicrobiales bacterium]